MALAQAVAATGADTAVLGTMPRPDVLNVTLLFTAGTAIHVGGSLPVTSRYPLTDAILHEVPIWLSSTPEIRHAYPAAGGIWGHAVAALPMMLRQVPVGAIGIIFDSRSHHFTPTERLVLSAISDICATVVSDPRFRPAPVQSIDQLPPAPYGLRHPR